MFTLPGEGKKTYSLPVRKRVDGGGRCGQKEETSLQKKRGRSNSMTGRRVSARDSRYNSLLGDPIEEKKWGVYVKSSLLEGEEPSEERLLSPEDNTE